MNLSQQGFAITLTICLNVLAFFPFETLAQNTLDIKVTNVKKNTGKIVVEIYSSKASWLKTPYQKIELLSNQDNQTAKFKVPYGNYAVTIYQDINSNGEADMNFIGVPKEPVGFGNNYKPFGEPKFEKALIVFKANSKTNEIKLFKVF